VVVVASTTLVSATVQGLHAAAGVGRVFLLTEAVIMAMRVRRITAWTAALLVGAGVAATVGVIAGVPTAVDASAPPAAAAGADEGKQNVDADQAQRERMLRLKVQLKQLDEKEKNLIRWMQDYADGHLPPEQRAAKREAIDKRKTELWERVRNDEYEVMLRRKFVEFGAKPTEAEVTARTESVEPVRHANVKLEQARAAAATIDANPASTVEQKQKAAQEVEARQTQVAELRKSNRDVARKVLDGESRQLVARAEQEIQRLSAEIQELQRELMGLNTEEQRLVRSVRNEIEAENIRAELRLIQTLRETVRKRELELELGLPAGK
jgi:hypothetical protein